MELTQILGSRDQVINFAEKIRLSRSMKIIGCFFLHVFIDFKYVIVFFLLI